MSPLEEKEKSIFDKEIPAACYILCLFACLLMIFFTSWTSGSFLSYYNKHLKYSVDIFSLLDFYLNIISPADVHM